MNESDLRYECYNNPEFFYRAALKIKTKEGGLAPLKLNKAQTYAQEKLDEQLRKTGKVRAFILKGRQQGMSTYISARYYHKTSHQDGIKTFILTHLQQATDNLYDMVKRYHDNNPIKPSTSTANAKELFFNTMDSGYKVGTAGSKAVGRSETIHLFHGSEVGFWDNAKEHLAGVLQAVPDLPNTEIIFESTANGVGNPFYEGCMRALSGASDYILIFIPWFWQDEYRTKLPDDFEVLDDERYLLDDLDEEQIYWRRKKIAELGDEALFKQEYPMNVQEAFQATSSASFIKPDAVEKCFKVQDEVSHIHPVQFGLDIARQGDDESVLTIRQGRKLIAVERYRIDNLVTLASKISDLIKIHDPVQVAIDTVGIGAGVYDCLEKWGYDYCLQAVNAGEKAHNQEKYFNMRAEMWARMKEAIEGGMDLPHDERLLIDLTGLQYSYDMKQRLQLEKKADMKKRGLSSPDSADSLALTFAYELAPSATEDSFTRNVEVVRGFSLNDYI